MGKEWRLPLHFSVVTIEKGAFWLPSTTVANLLPICLHWESFFEMRLRNLSRWLQDSAFLSEVAVNPLKTARGEIWPKRRGKNNKKLPRRGQKSAIKLILSDYYIQHVQMDSTNRVQILDRTLCTFTIRKYHSEKSVSICSGCFYIKWTPVGLCDDEVSYSFQAIIWFLSNW